MQKLSQALRTLRVMGLIACVIGGSPLTARGEETKTNACGCYQTTSGECICTRKSKCDCPGECEPKGCDEKRQKELEKVIKEETKKVEVAEKKRQEEAAEKQRRDEEQASEDGDSETANDTTSPQRDGEGAKEGKAKEKGKAKKDKNSAKTHSRADGTPRRASAARWREAG